MKAHLDHHEHRANTFLKPCVVSDSQVTLEWRGKSITLAGDCFKGLDGLTVLVDTDYNVTRSGAVLGKAHEV